MQALMMADELMQFIADGEKLRTIRKGVRTMTLGPCKIVSQSGELPELEVEIEYYTVVVLGLWMEMVGESEDFLESLQVHYPDMTEEHTITVIGWAP